MASVGAVASITPASAGFQGAPLYVAKTVSGTVPAGTTFLATVECDGNIIDGGDSSVDSAVLQFDATGQPTGIDSVTFLNPGECTVTEVVNGGASSTTYACESEIPDLNGTSTFDDVSPQQEAPPVCLTAGPQSAPITVNIVVSNQIATVTIHNTFTDPVPTPAPTPAAGVVAAPTFTG